MSEDEVEITATFLLRTAGIGIDIVEAVGPVDTHQTHHREIDTDTQSGRALHLEGIEILGLSPGITAFEEAESVDGGITQHERVAEFHCEAVVGIGIVCGQFVALHHLLVIG